MPVTWLRCPHFRTPQGHRFRATGERQSLQTGLEYSSIVWERRPPFPQALVSPWYVGRLPRRPTPQLPLELTSLIWRFQAALPPPLHPPGSQCHITAHAVSICCSCSAAYAESKEKPWAQPQAAVVHWVNVPRKRSLFCCARHPSPYDTDIAHTNAPTPTLEQGILMTGLSGATSLAVWASSLWKEGSESDLTGKRASTLCPCF